jgi:hypothetical protein
LVPSWNPEIPQGARRDENPRKKASVICNSLGGFRLRYSDWETEEKLRGAP